MSITPGKSRLPSLPTPGRTTGIPTPGRMRSASNATYQPPAPTEDEYAARAFADAMKANDPGHHRSYLPADPGSTSLSPHATSGLPQTGRRSSVGRPSSVASHTSVVSASNSRGFGASTPASVRAISRASDAHTKSAARLSKPFEVGDYVRVESLGFEGTIRYVGEVINKAGVFAGIELSGGFAGLGKNDGTAQG